MVEVKLSAAARRDLARIDEFSAAEFGSDAADEYVRGLKAAFDLLKRHPRAGEAHREYGIGVRCKVHRATGSSTGLRARPCSFSESSITLNMFQITCHDR